MSDFQFERSVSIARPAADVFAWHERPGALQRLLPPWEHVEVESQRGGIRDGAEVVARVRIGPANVRWVLRHTDYVAGHQFRDLQVKGPFAHWEHWHRFKDDSAGGSVLTDSISYRPPRGTGWAERPVRTKLERMFRYRHEVTKYDLELPPEPVGRVLISGASGLLGGALVPYLRTQGWKVHRLVRRAAQAEDEVRWRTADGAVEWPAEVSFDAVIHLAAAGVADRRWSAQRKAVIRESREAGTRKIVEAILSAPHRPNVLISGSATGYYGDGGEAILTEQSPAGRGFLADVCRGWEAALEPARRAGVRTVAVRTGVVLTPAGGALARLLPVFRAGAGGRLGHGRQWMNWITLDDWLDVVRRLLTDSTLDQAVNAVAPAPVRNAEFSAALGEVLRRPVILPVPAAALRLAVGEMADEALLASARVEPALLFQRGHRFRYPTLLRGLRHVLGR